MGVEGLPSTTTKILSEENNSLAESQFYARSSNKPTSNRHEIHSVIIEEKKPNLAMSDFIDNSSSSQPTRPVSSSIIINPFERLRPMELRPKATEEATLQIFDQSQEIFSKVSEPVKIQDENNDSSTSTNTSRSVHLPVEKQRGLSEIIRKRNSKYKVEDYKRAIQKPNIVDEEQQQPSIPPVTIEPENPPITSIDPTPKYFDVPINVQNKNDQRAQLSIERLNSLLSQEDEEEE